MGRVIGLWLLVLVMAGCATDAGASPGTGSGPAATGAAGSPPVVTSPGTVATPRATPTPPTTAAPPAPPTASPTAAPTPTPTAAWRWERVATVTLARGQGAPGAMAASSLGIVATMNQPAGAWFSADGVTWSSTMLTVPDGTALAANAVAATADAFVIVGTSVPCTRRAYERDPFWECQARPTSWVSHDGRTWTPSRPWTGPMGEPGRSGALFYAVWPVPTGGWDAAQALDPSDESDDFELVGPAIWHADDGLAWTALSGLPAEPTEVVIDDSQTDIFDCPDPTAVQVHAAADRLGRRIIASGENGCRQSAWTSADGRHWTAIDALATDGVAVPVVSGVLPGDRTRPWRLLGWPEDPHFNPMQAMTWESDDLVTWTMAMLPGGDGPRGIVRTAARGAGLDVAAGWVGDQSSRTWVDDGTTGWRQVAGASPLLDALAPGPQGIVGILGTWDAASGEVVAFEAWRLVPATP